MFREKKVAKRRSKPPKKKTINVDRKEIVKVGEVEPGDFCYFLSTDNKTRWGEVLKVIITDDQEPIMSMQCQQNWSFHVAIMRLSAWEAKSLKGLKWDYKAQMGKV